MLKESERKGLFDELKEHKDKITELRNSLNETNNQKESWFEKKTTAGKDISNHIKKIKELKISRDKLSKQVRKLKLERKKFNDIVSKKIIEIKDMNSKRQDANQKYNIRGNPSKIKDDIDRLESNFETQVMSFESEKKVMQKIKELKKSLEEAQKVNKVWGQSHSLSKEIDGLKEKAESVHKDIQNKAAESQKKHEEMIEYSKSVDELKDKEKNAYEKFIEYKKKFVELNIKLKEELPNINNIKGKLDTDQKEVKNRKHEGEEKKLKQKSEEVQEKIRTRKKLTTEDLLIFQRTNKD